MLRRSSPFARYICRNLWNSISDRKQHYISRIYSHLFNLKLSRHLIRPYCRIHDLDATYLAQFTAPDGSGTHCNFQSFFSRKLVTPIEVTTETCWPCDGTLCESNLLDTLYETSIKGKWIDARQIFEPYARRIPGHYAFVNVFLHNKDYHRIHAPVSGVITSISRVPGKLTVLRPWLYHPKPSVPAFINERLNICIKDLLDRCWFLSAVGGPAVNSIQIAGNFSVGAEIRVAEELAFFSLGSSCCLAAPIFPRPLPIGSSVKVGDPF